MLNVDIQDTARHMADTVPTAGLDNLQLSDTAMIVNPDDLTAVEEKQDVDIINAESLELDDPESEPEGPKVLRADDCW